MKILMISGRVPYPPNKGEKIRSFHVLKHLAEQHEVYLASLIDDPADLQSLYGLSRFVQHHIYEVISPASKKAKSSLGLLWGRPVSVGYFYSRKLQAQIDALIDKVKLNALMCICSPTAEYLFSSRHRDGRLRSVRKIMDFIDVDSIKWRDFARVTHGPIKLVYALEAACLGRYERKVAAEFDHLTVVSEAENRYLNWAGLGKTTAIENGVDIDYFSPGHLKAERPPGPVLVFTGVMDYLPNVDGVCWFAAEIFPAIRRRFPDSNFWIIGSRPTTVVRELEKPGNGVRITGFVDDVRPYLAAADVCIVPLRLARGIQNKVLEAMATGKPVVATPKALEGIEIGQDTKALSADCATAFAEAVIRLLEEPAFADELGRCGRSYVEVHHNWNRNLRRLTAILEPQRAAGSAQGGIVP